MRRSHLYFIGVCVAWVIVLVLINPAYVEANGLDYTLGSATFSLFIPAIGYGAFLWLQGRRKKNTTNVKPI